VRQVITRNYSGRLYSIRPLGTPSALRVTEDHPLLVSTRAVVKTGKTGEEACKTRVEDSEGIEEGDYVTFPIPKETHDIDLYEQDVTIGQPSTGRRLSRKLSLKAEPDLFRLIGY